jgi:pimeloyl-ACP methyl ester carboxylesterase
MGLVRPFRIAVQDNAIDDLHARLDTCRWPDQVANDDWRYGTEKNYLRKLVHYWRHDFDWRRAEASINRFNQYLLDIDGLDTHFIHHRSPHPEATPIIITHGWPGSVVEFLELIPRLTEPERFGGRAKDAFHVVCPSLPGFGYSPPSPRPGMHVRVIAERHHKLMQGLGYQHYIAQGGDWGAAVTRSMPAAAPLACRAIHMNYVSADPPAGVADPMAGLSDAERKAMVDFGAVRADGFGYYHIQSTRPQSLAYGLNDSPLGLCAWIAEKFHAWSDCGGDIRNAIAWDALLTNISLYWFTATIGSSVRLYRENALALASGAEPKFTGSTVPAGAAIYPAEMWRPPKAWVERQYNLVHWFEAERGGHFAAMEQPDLFASDLWRFKQSLAQ